MNLFNIFSKVMERTPKSEPEMDLDTLKSLSTVEKETYLVKKVKTEDMLQFTMMPYNLNFPIQKFIRPGGHPFAYINLDAYNQSVARQELQKINEILQNDKSFSRLKNKPQIPVEDIVFHEYSKMYGYSRLMCSPYTITGKIAKYPLSLSFCTRLDNPKAEAHGNLFYGKNGKILKADVNIWKGDSGHVLTLKEINGVLQAH